MKPNLVAFAAGVLFAVGLSISGMAQPSKVVGFLDFAGDWDASLAFVMVGAIGVHALLRQVVARRGAPVFAASFEGRRAQGIDLPLVAGSAVFGIGWGLGGYCPGPAFVAAGAGGLNALLFVAAMSGGMLIHRFLHSSASDDVRQQASGCDAAPV